MPKIANTPTAPEYNALREKGHMLGEGRKDCAVVAVAMVTGVEYDVVLAEMTRLGRKPNCGTPMTVIIQALKSFGFRTKRMASWEIREIIDTYPGVHKNLKNITSHHPRRFHDSFKDQGTLLFRSSRHISAVIDGVNHDWSVNNSLQMIELYRVTKVGG